MPDYAKESELSTILAGQQIAGAPEKTTPVDADSVGISDSAASGILKKLTWANLKATLLATAMTWTGNQTFNGFTKLGSAGVALKMKEFTITTGSTEGATTNTTHGIADSSKIHAVNGVVFYSSSAAMGPGSPIAGYNFGTSFNVTLVGIDLHPTSSENILSKTAHIQVWYVE